MTDKIEAIAKLAGFHPMYSDINIIRRFAQLIIKESMTVLEDQEEHTASSLLYEHYEVDKWIK